MGGLDAGGERLLDGRFHLGKVGGGHSPLAPSHSAGGTSEDWMPEISHAMAGIGVQLGLKSACPSHSAADLGFPLLRGSLHHAWGTCGGHCFGPELFWLLACLPHGGAGLAECMASQG